MVIVPACSAPSAGRRISPIAAMAVLTTALACASPAFADNDGDHDNGHHNNEVHHRQPVHGHGRNWQQENRQYREPQVVYAPPPVYYGQPPGVSLNFLFPFYR